MPSSAFREFHEKPLESDWIRVAWGAQECQAFSTMGLQNGYLDNRSLVTLAWLDFITDPLNNVMVFVLECTPQWNPDMIKPFVDDIFDIQHDVLNPVDFGDPANRHRRVAIGNRRDACRFVAKFTRDLSSDEGRSEGLPHQSS